MIGGINKYSIKLINMKTLAIIILSTFIIFCVLLLSSCNNETIRDTEYRSSKHFKPVEINTVNPDVYILTIDSCEYIVTETYKGVSTIHKENCKNH